MTTWQNPDPFVSIGARDQCMAAARADGSCFGERTGDDRLVVEIRVEVNGRLDDVVREARLSFVWMGPLGIKHLWYFVPFRTLRQIRASTRLKASYQVAKKLHAVGGAESVAAKEKAFTQARRQAAAASSFGSSRNTAATPSS